MKRVLSVLLVLVMCASMLVLTASAAGTGSISATSATVPYGGGTATVSVSLDTNPGIMGMFISKTVPEGISISAAGTGIGGVWTIGTNYVWDDAADTTYTGKILSVTVTVDASVPAGDYNIVFNASGYNYNEEDVALGSAVATITVACDHNWGAWQEVNADQHKHVCSVCGGDELQNHTWNAGEITEQPTCGAAGERTFTCTGCGATKTEPENATGSHVYTNWTKVDDLQHQGTCSCGDTTKEDHTWDAGTVTTQPTCDKPGVKTFKCTKCDATKTEEVKATGNHTYGDWEEVDDKQHEGTCSCGATIKKDHVWQEIIDKKPTSTSTGLKHEECECGAKRNENTVIDKIQEGLDDVPKTGDITSDLVMITMAVVVMFCAAGAYIFKRKTR